MISRLAMTALAAVAVALPAAAQQRSTDREAERAAQREQRRAARAERQAERSQRFFMAMWMIQASDQPLGRRAVADNDYVVRNRLLPPGLIRITADAVEQGTNRVVVPSGSQLFALVTRGAPIWCVVGRRDPGTAERILLGGGANRQVCLTDLDKDGDLDAHFSVANTVRGVPNFSGYRPNDARPLTGAAYQELEPEQVESDYFVGIRYEGLAMLGARPVFSISFGNERSRQSLTEVIRPQRETNIVAAMGAEFEVVSREGETLAVDVRRNIPPQPFAVIQTVTYR